jgi:ATP:corrinoid adenosyltransferase
VHPQEFLELADIATEMVELKYLKDEGEGPREGIEY